MKKFLVVLAVAVSSVGFGQVTSTKITAEQADKAYAVSKSKIDLQIITNELFTEINNYRISNGLPVLVLDTLLINVAEYQASDMAKNKYVGHINTCDTMKYLKNRLQYYITSVPKYAGENASSMSIWLCSVDNISYSKAIFTQYKNSPGHNFIMLLSNFKKVGISIVRIEADDNLYSCITFTN
jgi:uncharacterized protein YkwD